MQYAILALKAQTALLTAWWGILCLAWMSNMPLLSFTALSMDVQHASRKFTRYRSSHIQYSQRLPLLPLQAKFPGKAMGVLPVKTARLWISYFLRVGMWLDPTFIAYYLLLVTKISVLIILIIPKSSAWWRCGYRCGYSGDLNCKVFHL
jgi:hypothetical protein